MGEAPRDALRVGFDRAAFMAMPGQWVDRIRQRHPMKKLILDMDSSVSET